MGPILSRMIPAATARSTAPLSTWAPVIHASPAPVAEPTATPATSTTNDVPNAVTVYSTRCSPRKSDE
jgi:hypothetical protein